MRFFHGMFEGQIRGPITFSPPTIVTLHKGINRKENRVQRPIDTGKAKCRRKGHTPPNRYGNCARCLATVRPE
jgi:hypothetical protein